MSLSRALVITRRETYDNMTDWRIVSPILTLAFIFPLIMLVAIRFGAFYIAPHNPLTIVEKFAPFSTLMVGFFPISFSLIMALETFVGEKERNTLEALLVMPVSDGELYLGKLLSAALPPLLLSYFALTIYSISLYIFLGYVVSANLLIQVFLLTSAEALVMVSGAVVVSSHTTTVRAANLLASFIILPMSLVAQSEVLLLIYGLGWVLWCILLIMIGIDVILIRLGIQLFSREDLLTMGTADLNWPAVLGVIRGALATYPGADDTQSQPGFWLLRWYRRDIPALLRDNRTSLAVVGLIFAGGIICGALLATILHLPTGQHPILSGADRLAALQLVTGVLPFVNIQILLLTALLSIFTFGAAGLLATFVPGLLLGFLLVQVAQWGLNPGLFFVFYLLPQALFAIPALLIGMSFCLRLGLSLVQRRPGLTLGAALLQSLVDFFKSLALVAPLLLLALLVESTLTRWLVLHFG